MCIGTEPAYFVTLTQKRIKKCQCIIIEIQYVVETIISVQVITQNEDFFLCNLPAVTNYVNHLHSFQHKI